ncbi:PKD domain-containing protein [Flavobacteriales bacterium]|nr:PKD domain-containing protein [Flavobacteriales bacterium]
MKNNFEHIIKNSLENDEVPYETGAWEKFNKAQTPTPFYKTKWFIGGAALIAIIATITLTNVNFNSTNTQLNVNDDEQIAQATNTNVKLENSTSENSEIAEVNNKKENDEVVTSSTIELPEINEEEIKDTTDIYSTINLLDETKLDENNIATTGVEKTKPLNTAKESKKIELIPSVDAILPQASFFIENTICKGNDINLIADKANVNYDYSWKLNENEIIFGKVVSTEATVIGQNNVTLYITQNGVQISEKRTTFSVLESPSNNINIELNQASLINELNFDLEDASNQIVWNFGDGTTSEVKNSFHTYKKAGKYTCKYTVTSTNGCSSTYERNINVKGYYNLRTDYGFSPGKRDNVNDVFIPVELKELNVPFEMSIYARNGQLLYTTISIDKPWDGRMKDGSTSSFGSYVWIVSLTNKLGEKEVYKGTVTNVSN